MIKSINKVLYYLWSKGFCFCNKFYKFLKDINYLRTNQCWWQFLLSPKALFSPDVSILLLLLEKAYIDNNTKQITLLGIRCWIHWDPYSDPTVILIWMPVFKVYFMIFTWAMHTQNVRQICSTNIKWVCIQL